MNKSAYQLVDCEFMKTHCVLWNWKTLNPDIVQCYQRFPDSLFFTHHLMYRKLPFDGPSNLSGICNGVQALIKKEVSQALYVHCLIGT